MGGLNRIIDLEGRGPWVGCRYARIKAAELHVYINNIVVRKRKAKTASGHVQLTVKILANKCIHTYAYFTTRLMHVNLRF